MSSLYEHIVHHGPPTVVLASVYAALCELAAQPRNDGKIAYVAVDDDLDEYLFGFWELERALTVLDEPQHAEHRALVATEPAGGQFWCVAICKQAGVGVLTLPARASDACVARPRLPPPTCAGGCG